MRDKGSGSVHQRKDGRWAGTIEAGWTSRGTRRRITVYAPTKREALQKMKAKQREISMQGIPDEQITKALKVNARTVRHWRAGTAPIPAGVTAEMWGLWGRLLEQAYATIGDTAPDQPVILDTDTPQPLILAVATLHGRVVVKPEPPRYY
ncbi:hypothetical protein [Trueperella pyogenes]